MAVCLALFGGIAWITRVAEQRRHGRLLDETRPAHGPRWLKGPWPLVAGAVGLALVNIATLTIGGRPWGVTSAFALWGAKLFAALGIDVASWAYWTTPAQATALRSSVLMDVTSVMDFGIILGALMAAILAGKFAPVWKVSNRSLAAAVIGGILLGYGARIAYGCNIGAYFSGIASGSLHGWLWLVGGLRRQHRGDQAAADVRPERRKDPDGLLATTKDTKANSKDAKGILQALLRVLRGFLRVLRGRVRIGFLSAVPRRRRLAG